jgi:hypothetical protein
LNSSNSENDFLYGDTKIGFGTPLSESFGRRISSPEDEPALAARCLSEE